jgi:hypothetical protein
VDDEKRQDVARKISIETFRFVGDYYEKKISRLKDKAPAQFVYMAMLGGTIAAVVSIIEAIEKSNPQLSGALRADIAAKVMGTVQ